MKSTRLSTVALAAFAILCGSSCSKKKKEDAAAEAMKNAALIALKANPDVEVLKTDDAKGEVTFRDKKSGEEVTLSFSDLGQGKFNMKVKDANGRETAVSANSDGAGAVTVTGPDGKMMLGDDAAGSAPPAWVFTYPGAKAMPGSMRAEHGDALNGSYVSETTDSTAKVKEFYEAKLKEQGFKTEAMALDTDGKDNATVSGEKTDPRQKITVVITAEGSRTNVMIVYDGPKK